MGWTDAILLVSAENERDALSEAWSWIGNAFAVEETGPFDKIEPEGAVPARGNGDKGLQMIRKAEREEADLLVEGWTTVASMTHKYPCLPSGDFLGRGFRDNNGETKTVQRGLQAAREVEELALHRNYRTCGDKGIMCKRARLYDGRRDKEGPVDAHGVWVVSLSMHY